MELTVEQQGESTLAVVEASRLDAAVAIHFKDLVREKTERTTGRVILDLGKVDFLDSSGLGAVVAVMKFLGKERPLHLAALTPTVQKVFELTFMDRVFVIHDSVSAALSDSANAA